MALSEQVLAVIARVTPEELAQTRRWCELGTACTCSAT